MLSDALIGRIRSTTPYCAQVTNRQCENNPVCANLNPTLGRLDQLIYVGLPDLDDRVQIIEALRKKMAIAPSVNDHKLAERMEYCTGADIEYAFRWVMSFFTKTIGLTVVQTIARLALRHYVVILKLQIFKSKIWIWCWIQFVSELGIELSNAWKFLKILSKRIASKKRPRITLSSTVVSRKESRYLMTLVAKFAGSFSTLRTDCACC